MKPMADSGGGERRRSSRVLLSQRSQSRTPEVQVPVKTTPTPAEAIETSRSPDDEALSTKRNLRKRKAAAIIDDPIEEAMRPLTVEEREGWKGWIELESEPYLFNHILRSYGVKDVKVQEVIGLDMLPFLEKPVYGLIFLFRYQDSDAEEAEGIPKCPKHVWFANQTTDNACATIALLNIVMNISEIALGEALTEFKNSTKKLKPAYRGQKLGEDYFIRNIHNSFVRRMDILNADLALQNEYDKWIKSQRIAETLKKPTPKPKNSRTAKYSKPQSKPLEAPKAPQKKKQDDTEAGFHFIAYVPVDGSVWKLDGLRQQPVNIGDCGEDWTTVAHDNILQRTAHGDDIAYNLMSLLESPLVRIRLDLARTIKSIEAVEEVLNLMAPDWKVISEIDGSNDKSDLHDSFELTQEHINNAEIMEEAFLALAESNPSGLIKFRRTLSGQLTDLRSAYTREIADIAHDDEKAEARKHDHTPDIYKSIKTMSETGALKDIVLGLQD